MTRYCDPMAQWRAVAVVLASVLTATVAHTAAGGGVPGPGGWAVVFLCLIPVAALARGRTGRGAPGLAVAGLLGQAVGHVALSVVTLGPITGQPGLSVHHSPSSGHPTVATAGHGLGHGHGAPPLPPGTGWGVTSDALAHPAHMEPAMVVAHLVGAALTAMLVAAAAEGLRRVAARLILLVRALFMPRTPFPGTPTAARVTAPATVRLLTQRSLRGPPLPA
ncbi:hypothetical protein [Dietzia psychralcaliphila]|uniref:Integral membrane protein n=1 Tax=Dietzia psychralcaliphila TaxID=139021 RepID=A0AAD0NPB7_9ACTN|nr:hypothetical protein [Dietzia psychralcaliphila]AWH96911.1 hypothetical protein A6048_16985 [Dietzia psychralcaliphila]